MEDALRALPGVSGLETVLETDTFFIDFDPAKIDVAMMLKTVEDAGYSGEIVKGAAAKPASAANDQRHIEIAKLPEELQQAFAAAKREGKNLLIDFHAPG